MSSAAAAAAAAVMMTYGHPGTPLQQEPQHAAASKKRRPPLTLINLIIYALVPHEKIMNNFYNGTKIAALSAKSRATVVARAQGCCGGPGAPISLASTADHGQFAAFRLPRRCEFKPEASACFWFN